MAWASSASSRQGWGSSCLQTWALWFLQVGLLPPLSPGERRYQENQRMLIYREEIHGSEGIRMDSCSDRGRSSTSLHPGSGRKDASAKLCWEGRDVRMNCFCHTYLITLCNLLNSKPVKPFWEGWHAKAEQCGLGSRPQVWLGCELPTKQKCLVK